MALGAGYAPAAWSATLWQFALVHLVLVGFLGSSATFGPVIADVSRWFFRHRGIAVGVASCGSYLAGTVWPPVIQHFVDTAGWRATRPADLNGLTPGLLQGLLVVAGLTCCIAMAMQQVHVVSLCTDLGYGTARGAEMLSVMLAAGVLSRLGFGWLVDRIGPLPTFLIGSALQALSLLLFLPSDSLPSLFMVSALFGLAQGGIVPTYAAIIRRYYPSAEAGTRIGTVLGATLVGMALGGWMSGAIFDLTMSYDLAFLNGFLWNLVNLAIAVFLLMRLGRRTSLMLRTAA